MRAAAVLAAISLGMVAQPSAAGQAQMDEASARAIVDGCVAYARNRSISVAVAVVDNYTAPVALLRMDGSRATRTNAALAMAQTVADTGISTADLAAGVKPLHKVGPGVFISKEPGGLPVYSNDGKAFLGAVGVASRWPADGVACAQAGIAAAGLKSSRAR